MKNYVQKTLIAHFFGFLILILTHILWSINVYGDASSGDTGIIIFWAGIFLTIFYLLFILIPKNIIQKLSLKLNVFTFSIGFAIYSLVGFIILIGWMFINSTFSGVFFDAFFYGLTFGIIYHKLSNSKLKVKNFAILLLIPIFIFFIYLSVLPRIFPTFAFKIVPKQTKNEILKRTLKKFKKGDDFNDLKKALPGYFHNLDCNLSTNAVMEDFQYTLIVENCKITKIEYGPRKYNNGITEMVVEEAIEKK